MREAARQVRAPPPARKGRLPPVFGCRWTTPEGVTPAPDASPPPRFHLSFTSFSRAAGQIPPISCIIARTVLAFQTEKKNMRLAESAPFRVVFSAKS